MSYDEQHRGSGSAYDRYLEAMDATMRQKVALTAAHLLAEGRVADVQYLGSFSRVRVLLDGGGVLVASVASDGLAGTTTDSHVRLAWARDAASAVATSDHTDPGTPPGQGGAA